MSGKVVEDFWAAMGTNDFDLAAGYLAADFEYFMPQTGEYLAGPTAFAALNKAYPAQGRWVFTVDRIIAAGAEVVSDVRVTDGSMTARAITFHSVAAGLIQRQVEYWPDDYPAPEWRKSLVRVLTDPPF